jgi:REP element-mobilizing transposase RayT
LLFVPVGQFDGDSWLAQSEALRFRLRIRYATLVMSISRRYFAPGQLQFITSGVDHRVKLFESQRFRSVFVETLRELRREKGFLLLGWVLMPEHFHLLIKPEPAEATSGIMRESKKRTAQAIVSILG